jgi:hypothetical protein
VEVDEDDWAADEFGPESGLSIQRDFARDAGFSVTPI